MNIVILSPNNFDLLQKMRFALKERGWEDRPEWNSHAEDLNNDPTFIAAAKSEGRTSWYQSLRLARNKLSLYNHDCFGDTPYTLTPENFDEILNLCTITPVDSDAEVETDVHISE